MEVHGGISRLWELGFRVWDLGFQGSGISRLWEFGV